MFLAALDVRYKQDKMAENNRDTIKSRLVCYKLVQCLRQLKLGWSRFDQNQSIIVLIYLLIISSTAEPTLCSVSAWVKFF